MLPVKKLLPSILFFCLLALPAKSQSLIDIVEGSHQDVSLDVLCGPKQQKCQITFSEEELELLVKNEILTIENLADLATDELTEIFEIDEERAAKLIMSAREEWLED